MEVRALLDTDSLLPCGLQVSNSWRPAWQEVLLHAEPSCWLALLFSVRLNSISFCVCICICVCTVGGAGTYMSLDTWRPEVVISFFFSPSPILFWDKFSGDLESTHLVRLSGQWAPAVCPSASLTPQAQMWTLSLSFHVGTGNPNTGLHACTASTYQLAISPAL